MDAGAPIRPLAGLRVLDLSRLYPGAMCSLLLADLGAAVVKVEAPGAGDGMRHLTPDEFKSAHVAYNRGKQSITLDLRHPQALSVLQQLVRGNDVLIESHRPGALEQLGLGYEQMRAVNQQLIWCSITGFGPDGPMALAPGHDLTYIGYAGLLSSLGCALPPDITLALPFGALMATVGILAALARRSARGEGSRIDTSLADSAMWALSEDVARTASSPGPGWPPLASRAIYRCADGRSVTVTASEPKPWAALCAALQLPDLIDHQLGVDEERVTARLAAAFATRPATHWLTKPGLAGGVGPVNTAADLLDDPQVAARHGIVSIEGRGPLVLANPLRFDGATNDASTAAAGAPPALGEHTDAVLAAAGFDESAIAALRRERVI